jgi:hypothetical protein
LKFFHEETHWADALFVKQMSTTNPVTSMEDHILDCPGSELLSYSIQYVSSCIVVF